MPFAVADGNLLLGMAGTEPLQPRHLPAADGGGSCRARSNLAWPSHLCAGSMPGQRDFRLFDRPRSYGFESFDDLMSRLRAAVPDSNVCAEVLAALQIEGRQLDVDQLAMELQLDAPVVLIVEQLAGWGDELLLDEVGVRRIATVNAGSLLGHCDLATHLLARRCDRGFELFFMDENGGYGQLGEYAQPLSLLELTIVLDGILIIQAPYDVVDGTWQSGYFRGDPSMTVRVSSPYYPRLSAWYEEAIAEWVAAHDRDE